MITLEVLPGTVTVRCVTQSVSLALGLALPGPGLETSAVAGTLLMAGAAGRRAGDHSASSRAAPALISVAGGGRLIGLAVFTTDPVTGYPPETPDALTHPSRAGAAHNLAAVPVFLGLPAAGLTSAWRARRAAQRGYPSHYAGHHGPGRCRLRPVTAASASRRAIPARQHHHRLHPAHSSVRTSTSA